MATDDTPRITFANGRKIINAPKIPQAPQFNQGETRKLSKRRIVGDRSTLYEVPVARRNPNASLKDFAS
jgi:hypothetical protein